MSEVSMTREGENGLDKAIHRNVSRSRRWQLGCSMFALAAGVALGHSAATTNDVPLRFAELAGELTPTIVAAAEKGKTAHQNLQLVGRYAVARKVDLRAVKHLDVQLPVFLVVAKEATISAVTVTVAGIGGIGLGANTIAVLGIPAFSVAYYAREERTPEGQYLKHLNEIDRIAQYT